MVRNVSGINGTGTQMISGHTQQIPNSSQGSTLRDSLSASSELRVRGRLPSAVQTYTDNDDFSRNAETLPHESNGKVESNKKHMATMCHLCKIFSRGSGKEFVVEWLEFNGHRFLSSSENKGLLKSRSFAPACSAS